MSILRGLSPSKRSRLDSDPIALIRDRRRNLDLCRSRGHRSAICIGVPATPHFGDFGVSCSRTTRSDRRPRLVPRNDLFPSRKLTVFEHGGRSSSETTGCLEHCHLHILDGQFDLVDALIAIYPEAEEVTVSSTTNITSESSYLLAGVYEGSTVEGVMVHAPGCGSQFFRRTLAALVHEEQEWNWRAFPKPEVAISLCKVWPATRSKSIRPA